MTESIHDVRFPGESQEYRAARDELLKAELELRRRLEEVAALRRTLPLGGRVAEDYVFEEIESGTVRETKLSELFAPAKDSLIVYSFMYGPADEAPCPMCSSFLDSVDGSAPHITQRVNLAVVAKSPIERIRNWAAERGWSRLRLLSSAENTYNADYHGETAEGGQLPNCNVFRKTPEGVFHFYSSEILFSPVDGHPRHVDLMWPLWNFLDLTPDGRGTDWMPRLSYDG